MSKAEYRRERRKRLRQEAIERLGGECVRCGTTEGLEFDHIDPKTKKFKVTDLDKYPIAEWWAEVDKCQLLCRPCHLEKSYEGGELAEPRQHGTVAMYKIHGCRCDKCRIAKNEYKRAYKRRKKTEAQEKARRWWEP
jgi:hypothetical protein